MTTMHPLMAQFADQPCLIDPGQRSRFESCIAAVAGHEHAGEMLAASGVDADFWGEDGSWKAQLRPYRVDSNGILQIPVKGVLLHNFPYALFDWATGYDYIWEAFKRGCADFAIGAIRGIALVCDSPGGMVAGCFDTRDKMLALQATTGVPVRGFAHESAYSAAYAIITVAPKGGITVSRTGGVGSIGVVTGHMDVSGAMEKAGLKFTYIVSDPSKVEGNSYEAPSTGFLERMQERINELYGIFVAAVAESRGLDEAVIRGTLKAYCYTATQAVSNGLADQVGSLDDALSAFAGFLDAPSSSTGENAMATEAATVELAVHEKAVADARREGETAGAATQLTRINAIVGCDAAKDRPKAALSAALKTGMSTDEASAFLGDLPKEAAAAPAAEGTSFADAMEGDNPDVGAANENRDEKAENGPAALLALGARAGIRGFAAPAK
jgi:ClpP class serine protease